MLKHIRVIRQADLYTFSMDKVNNDDNNWLIVKVTSRTCIPTHVHITSHSDAPKPSYAYTLYKYRRACICIKCLPWFHQEELVIWWQRVKINFIEVNLQNLELNFSINAKEMCVYTNRKDSNQTSNVFWYLKTFSWKLRKWNNNHKTRTRKNKFVLFEQRACEF